MWDSAKIILSDYHEVESNLPTYPCQVVLMHQQTYRRYYKTDWNKMATATAVDGIWTMNGWFLLIYSWENYCREDKFGAGMDCTGFGL